MEEELQEIIEQDVKEIATRVEHADVVATTRNFIKLFMKKKVAMTYSLTRLGYGRKKVKKSFVEIKLYQLLLKTKMGEEMKDEVNPVILVEALNRVFRVFVRKYHSVLHSLIDCF
ncbi:uncharacterized protein LOC143451758 [Clavelina lepadiformis]|uniref:uncharacterized protein LOC143451758 n=1 Tax=Clavelina lepadiformis TaxID=159417 RepID=UPI0040424A29